MELLVVIAILAILMALLMPALRGLDPFAVGPNYAAMRRKGGGDEGAGVWSDSDLAGWMQPAGAPVAVISLIGLPESIPDDPSRPPL